MGSACSNRPVTIESNKNKIKLRVNEFSNITNIHQRFEFISQLGMGSFGKVRLYRDKQFKELLYAIKTLKKDNLPPQLYACIKREIQILSELDHPNIVKYYGTFEDCAYLHIVMEYLQGYNLYKIILEKEFNELNESEMCLIIIQLLNALSFIHSREIVHRDIKPENIVFAKKDDYSTLKLIDFGLAISSDNKDRHSCGTPFYMAPELIDGNYSTKTDIWSVGIILHLMLTGKYPFDEDRKNDIFYYIQKKKFDPSDLNESDCSEEVKDLIIKMLDKDPEKRISTIECLNHPWIKNSSLLRTKTLFNEGTAKTLRSFAHKSKLQKELYYFIAKIIADDETKKLKEMFLQIDTSQNGELSFDEIKRVFEKAGYKISEKELKVICEGLDFHNDGKINYTEFLAAMISEYSFKDDEKLWQIFCYFTNSNSKDENRVIDMNDILEKANNLHIKIDEKELRHCFDDLNRKGRSLSYKNFKKMMNSKK